MESFDAQIWAYPGKKPGERHVQMWFLIAGVVIGIVVTLLYVNAAAYFVVLRDKTQQQNKSMQKFFPVAYGLVLFEKYLREIWEDRYRREFMEIFGFWPYPETRKNKENKREVDYELCVLASTYYDADILERDYRFEGNYDDARGIRMPLEVAKNRFWRAHSLAKRFGFKVEERYTDYL